MGNEKKDKRARWSQYPNRLNDALISNVHANQLDNLKFNVSSLRSDLFNDKLKRKLLSLSISNGSKDCALFLIEQGSICNPYLIPSECRYDKIDVVCDILEELMNEYPQSFTPVDFGTNINFMGKKVLIKRILDPSKVVDNPGRVDYLMKNTHFFDTKDIKEVINEEFKSNPEKWSSLISLLRDIKLKELGI
jgi:hypothetical protein